MGAHAVARGPGRGRGRAKTGEPRWLGGAPFLIPNLEALDVEMKGPPAGRQCHPLHHQLLFRKDRFAGVARFSVAWTTPHPCDAVMWKATVPDLVVDESTEGLLIHGGLAGNSGPRKHAQLTGSRRLERQPLRPGCRRGERSTDG